MADITRRKRRKLSLTAESIINLLGVVYAQTRMSDEGDLYLTEFGLQYSDLLDIRNWYEREWFKTQRVRLSGTSSVFRVPTKEVNGRQLLLVVKNNRFGEDVPFDTHTLSEFINAEFNSPWEEFALTFELRENKFGSSDVSIKTQQPLAIYVPPEELQLWQTGRSREKINKITLKYPNINLDILRQYKMVYKWIDGLNIVEILKKIGVTGPDLHEHLAIMTDKGSHDLDAKGFIMADMKPSHIIIDERHVKVIDDMGNEGTDDCRNKQTEFLHSLVEDGHYSVVDYELLTRTSPHEQQVKKQRRHHYLDDQRDRFQKATLPPFLVQDEIFGVPYVHGHVESTGGLLWVVGCNPRLYDYFLPERWRKTPCQSFSKKHEVFYTVTKDNIHIVWKTSRLGEEPQPNGGENNKRILREYGFNSPFEEFAIAHHLTENGIPTIYVRAIYMTGSTKTELPSDTKHYASHGNISALDNETILRKNHDYITIQGYYNGSDTWVASHEGQLCTPFDLERAGNEGILAPDECLRLLEVTRSRLKNVGYDGSLLALNDILIALNPQGKIIEDSEHIPEARICNFELIHTF